MKCRVDRKHFNKRTDDPGSPLRPGTTSMLPNTYPGSPCKTEHIFKAQTKPNNTQQASAFDTLMNN